MRIPVQFSAFYTVVTVTNTNTSNSLTGLKWLVQTFCGVFQLSLADEHKKLPSGTYQVRVFDEEGYAWLRKVRTKIMMSVAMQNDSPCVASSLSTLLRWMVPVLLNVSLGLAFRKRPGAKMKTQKRLSLQQLLPLHEK